MGFWEWLIVGCVTIFILLVILMFFGGIRYIRRSGNKIIRIFTPSELADLAMENGGEFKIDEPFVIVSDPLEQIKDEWQNYDKLCSNYNADNKK